MQNLFISQKNQFPFLIQYQGEPCQMSYPILQLQPAAIWWAVRTCVLRFWLFSLFQNTCAFCLHLHENGNESEDWLRCPLCMQWFMKLVLRNNKSVGRMTWCRSYVYRYEDAALYTSLVHVMTLIHYNIRNLYFEIHET